VDSDGRIKRGEGTNFCDVVTVRFDVLNHWGS
jgi:hypothetical protein